MTAPTNVVCQLSSPSQVLGSSNIEVSLHVAGLLSRARQIRRSRGIGNYCVSCVSCWSHTSALHLASKFPNPRVYLCSDQQLAQVDHKSSLNSSNFVAH